METHKQNKKHKQTYTQRATDRKTKKVIRRRENHTHTSPACRNFSRPLVTCAHLYLFGHWIPVVCPDIWPRSCPLAASEGSQHTTHYTFSPHCFYPSPPPLFPVLLLLAPTLYLCYPPIISPSRPPPHIFLLPFLPLFL